MKIIMRKIKGKQEKQHKNEHDKEQMKEEKQDKNKHGKE